MIKTDYHEDSLGTRDFVFSCHNRAFATTWSPLLPKPSETLIDSELTEFLDIPIKKIEARKFSFAGTETRIVGHISQTVQCVVDGKTSGTIHIKASVVRHLTKLFNMDCVAGGQMYRRLASTPDRDTKNIISSPTTNEVLKDTLDKSPSTDCQFTPKKVSNPSTPTNSILSSPGTPLRSTLHKSWLFQNGCDERYDVDNDEPVDSRWSYDEDYEMWGLPYNLTGPLIKPDPKDSMVTYIIDKEDNMIPYMNAIHHNWPDIGQTFPPSIPITSSSSIQPIKPDPTKLDPNKPEPSAKSTTAYSCESTETLLSTKPKPTLAQPPLHFMNQPNADKVLLQDLVLCGHYQPCPCLPKLSQQQASLLPPHYPLYLPKHPRPCGPNCGCHHVHQAGACHCVPPSINQYLDPPDWFWEMFPIFANTSPSIQNVTLSTPASSANLEMCEYCDREDDLCTCEDLYFRLKEEQPD